MVAGAAWGGQLYVNDPDDAIRVLMKTRCSMNDGETALYWWEGRMYSRVPGEKDRHLFNVQGMNIRHCETLTDPFRGLGFAARSRELMFYLDPETNEVLRTWTNAWTGEEVEVVQVANDPPGDYRETWARDEEGNPSGAFFYFFKDGVMMHGGGPRGFSTTILWVAITSDTWAEPITRWSSARRRLPPMRSWMPISLRRRTGSFPGAECPSGCRG